MEKPTNSKTKTGQSKKDMILLAAEQLILLRGYNGTSIDDICQASNVKKGAFFHHFSSKEELATTILRKYWAQTVAMLHESPLYRSKDPLKRLLGVVDFFESVFEVSKRPTACLIGNITQEVALTNDLVRLQCESIFQEWIEGLGELLRETNSAYPTDGRLDVRGLAEFIISTIEGAFILVKASNDLSQSRRVLRHLKRYLRSIFDAP